MSKVSDIEIELQKASGVKPKAKENRQKYLKRVFDATEALPQEDWSQLSKPAQVWYNKAMEVLNEAEDKNTEAVLPDFEPETKSADADKSPKETKATDADDDAQSQKDEGTVASKKKGKGAAEKKAPAKKIEETKTAAKPAKKAAANGGGEKRNKLQTILGVIWSHPKLSTKDLIPKIRDEGCDTSESTITTVRSDFIRSARFINKKGGDALEKFITKLDAD
jgi:hypothetical protein